MRLLLAPLLLSACTHVGSAFSCATDAQCGNNGVCEPSTSYCSFPSTTCSSQRVYDSSAGNGLGGQCVAASSVKDGGASDGGTSASKCADFMKVAGHIACEGFENGSIDQPFDNYQSNGKITLDATQVYRGSAAGHFTTNSVDKGGIAAAQISLALTAAQVAAGQTLWLRGFFYFDAVPPTYTGIFSVQQPGGDYLQHAVYTNSNDTIYLSDSVFGSMNVATKPLVLNEWHCMVLKVVFNTAGEADLTLDGASTPTFTLTGNSIVTPPTTQFAAGMYYQPTSPMGPWELWMDEIALSQTEIGCSD